MILLDAIGVALLFGATTLLCEYHRRRQRIAEFARHATLGSRSQRDAAFTLASAIFGGVQRRGKDPFFLSRVLAPLGASPTTVLKRGGCCSGLHRLFITALDTLGIRAAQVTVFRRADPAAAHCLAQVMADGVKILIDADYGVWFRRPDGRPIDLVGLRSGVKPVIEPFVLDRQAPCAESTRTRSAGYPGGDYYRFDYELTRTANWAETWTKRTAYRVLYPLTAGQIDCLLLPPILEWPEVLVASGLCTATLGLLVARAVLGAWAP
jgi:hypothetical protein